MLADVVECEEALRLDRLDDRKALSDVSATLFVDGGADRRYGASAGWRLDAVTYAHSRRLQQTATLGFFITFA